jgi:hypothetical protein
VPLVERLTNNLRRWDNEHNQNDVWRNGNQVPHGIERIRLYEALIHNNIATWTPATEWATLDICKVVPMTAHEMAWFTRL